MVACHQCKNDSRIRLLNFEEVLQFCLTRTDAINSIATVRLQNHAEIDASGLIIAAARKGEKLLVLSEPVSFSITAGAINIKEISINKCNADTIEFFVWDGVNTLRPLCKSKVLPNLD